MPHRAESIGRSEHIWILALAVVAIIGSFALTPSLDGRLHAPFSLGGLGTELPDSCLFKNLSGLPCPGCGLTRSFVHLAHGHVFKAFGLHLMGPVLFILCILQIPYRLIEYAGVWSANPIWLKIKQFSGMMLWVVLGGMMIAWVVNLVGVLSAPG